METKTYKLKSVSRLLMHAPRCANKLDPVTIEIGKITSKSSKKKTEEDYRDLAKLEFASCLYLTDGGKITIPDYVWEGALISAAKKLRQGSEFKSSVLVTNVVFLFDGPQSPEKRVEDKSCVDCRPVVLTSGKKRATIMRTRPVFSSWSAEIEVSFDEKEVHEETLDKSFDIAGTLGVCDYRPKFGRFEVVKNV